MSEEITFQREAQQRQIESDPNSVYADTLRDEKVRNVIAQLNPELLLSEIEHRIRGEKKNYETDSWESIKKNGPMISEELVQNYIAFLNAYLTQNNSLSNFSPREINNIMRVVIDYIRDDLSDNSYKYELTQKKEIKMKFTNYILYPVKDHSSGIMHMLPKEVEVEESIPIAEEITDYNEMTRIGHIVCQSTFAVLKQAQNGMLSSRVFKALRVSENLNDTQQKKTLRDLFKL